MNKHKKLSPKLLNKYLRDTLELEYNMKFTEREMDKILDGMKIGIDRLVNDCYNFKLFGFKFEVYHKTPKIYKNVRTGEIEVSKPHFALRIKVPRQYQRELKEKTRYNSNEKPIILGSVKEDVEIK